MTDAVDWKKLLLVALVVLLVLAGVPLLMPGMGSAMCSDCGPAVMGPALCLIAIVLATVGLLLAPSRRVIRCRADDVRMLLFAVFFDRPPQLA